MTNQLNLEELEAKTSPEFVAEIKNDLVNYKGEERQIQAFNIEHFKSSYVDVEHVAVYMIADEGCYKYLFDCVDKTISRYYMSIFTIKKFAKMCEHPGA